MISCVQLFDTPWTVAHQPPLSMEFFRQEYWSGLPCPSPGIFPIQESNPGLLYCRQILYHLSHQGSPSKIKMALRKLNSTNNPVILKVDFSYYTENMGFPCSSVCRESACNAGDLCLTSQLGRSPGGGNGSPLQYSCLEKPMDRGAW